MFWPGLKPHQTRIIHEALKQMTTRPEDALELAKLLEWFESEVKVNKDND